MFKGIANSRKTIGAVLAAILFAGMQGPAPGQARRDDPFASQLPAGKGREAVVEFCSGACHLSDKIVNTRKSPEEWRRTVLQMIERGAQLFPEDVDVLTDYLAQHLSAGTKNPRLGSNVPSWGSDALRAV